MKLINDAWYGTSGQPIDINVYRGSAASMHSDSQNMRPPPSAHEQRVVFGEVVDSIPKALSGDEREILGQQMSAAINGLKVALLKAKGTLLITPSMGLGLVVDSLKMVMGPLGLVLPSLTMKSAPDEVKAAVSSGLNSIGAQIDLRIASMNEVLDGRLEPSKWFAAVKETEKGMARILAGLKEDSTAALMSKQVDQAEAEFYRGWETFKKGAGEVGSKVAMGGGVLLLVLLGVAAFIVVPVAREYLRAPLKMARLAGHEAPKHRRKVRRK